MMTLLIDAHRHADLIEAYPAASNRSHIPVEEVLHDYHTQMAIDFNELPPDFSVRTLLGAIRVPDGRIRVVAFNVPGRQARVVFAEVTAHECFMRAVYEGTWRVPNVETSYIRVHQEIVPRPRGEEANPEATRVLMIRGPPGEHKAINVVSHDLLTTSHDWRYDIEKMVQGEDGEGQYAKFLCIYFGSIQDAVHAQRALCLQSPVAIKYGQSRFSFGYDDCSTTGPGERISMLSIRDMRLPPSSTTGFLNVPPFRAVGTVKTSMFPPTGATHQLPPRPPVSMPPPPTAPRALRALLPPPSGPARPSVQSVMAGSSGASSHVNALVNMNTNLATTMLPPVGGYRVDMSAGLYPLPPFDCHKHGIVVHQVPHLITEAALLAAIHGGNVRRVFIFRPGKHIDGTAAHGAVFFNSQEVANAVLDRMIDRKGLYIPLVRRRYRVTPYTTSSHAVDEYFPPDQTRVLSLSFADSPGNARITLDSLREWVRDHTRIVLADGEISQLPKFPGLHQRRFLFTLGSIKAATLIKVALVELPLAGNLPSLVQYERDPCAGPVERMG